MAASPGRQPLMARATTGVGNQRPRAYAPIPTRADAPPSSPGALPPVGGDWLAAALLPTQRPSVREEAAQVERWLEEALAARGLAAPPPRTAAAARAPPPHPSLADELADAERLRALFAVLNQALHELARQVAAASQERGRVLWRVWCLACDLVEQLLGVIQRVRSLHGSALTDVQTRVDDAQREAAELRARLAGATARADAADLTVAKLRAQYAALLAEAERLQQFGADVKALLANREERDGLLDKLKREAAAAAAELELSHARMRHYEKAAKQAEFERNAADQTTRALRERVAELEALVAQRDADARTQRTAATLAATAARTRLAALAAAARPGPAAAKPPPAMLLLPPSARSKAGGEPAGGAPQPAGSGGAVGVRRVGKLAVL